MVELLERAREQTWYRALELPRGEVAGHHATPEDLDGFRLVFCGSVIIRFAFGASWA